MDAVDQAIIETVERVTHPFTGAFDYVSAVDVAGFLPVRICDRAVRFRMVKLANRGVIHRLHYFGYISVKKRDRKVNPYAVDFGSWRRAG